MAVYHLDRAVFCQNGLSQKSFPHAFMILLTKAETTIFTLSQGQLVSLFQSRQKCHARHTGTILQNVCYSSK